MELRRYMALLYIIKSAHASNVRVVLLKFYLAGERAHIKLCKHVLLSLVRHLFTYPGNDEFVGWNIVRNRRATGDIGIVPDF